MQPIYRTRVKDKRAAFEGTSGDANTYCLEHPQPDDRDWICAGLPRTTGLVAGTTKEGLDLHRRSGDAGLRGIRQGSPTARGVVMALESSQRPSIRTCSACGAMAGPRRLRRRSILHAATAGAQTEPRHECRAAVPFGLPGHVCYLQFPEIGEGVVGGPRCIVVAHRLWGDAQDHFGLPRSARTSRVRTGT